MGRDLVSEGVFGGVGRSCMGAWLNMQSPDVLTGMLNVAVNLHPPCPYVKPAIYVYTNKASSCPGLVLLPSLLPDPDSLA